MELPYPMIKIRDPAAMPSQIMCSFPQAEPKTPSLKAKCTKWHPAITVDCNKTFELEFCFENIGVEAWPQDVCFERIAGDDVPVLKHTSISCGKPFSCNFKAPGTAGKYFITYRLSYQ